MQYGCCCCGNPIDEAQANDIGWYGEGNPICPECVGNDSLMAIIGNY